MKNGVKHIQTVCFNGARTVIKNSSLGTHFLSKLFFGNLIFEPRYLLKSYPIFDKASIAMQSK